MFCRTCGTQNDDRASKCIQCGAALDQGIAPPFSAPPQQIQSYLVPAILVTIFCCWPLGIPAIVYAAHVGGHVGAGNIPAALEASQKAKMWCWISFGGAVALIALYFLFAIIMAAIQSGIH